MGFPLGVKWHLSSATWAWLPLVTQGSLACLRLRAKYRLFSMVSKNRSFGPLRRLLSLAELVGAPNRSFATATRHSWRN